MKHKKYYADAIDQTLRIFFYRQRPHIITTSLRQRLLMCVVRGHGLGNENIVHSSEYKTNGCGNGFYLFFNL